jgi:hypothetical protein
MVLYLTDSSPDEKTARVSVSVLQMASSSGNSQPMSAHVNLLDFFST